MLTQQTHNIQDNLNKEKSFSLSQYSKYQKGTSSHPIESSSEIDLLKRHQVNLEKLQNTKKYQKTLVSVVTITESDWYEVYSILNPTQKRIVKFLNGIMNLPGFVKIEPSMKRIAEEGGICTDHARRVVKQLVDLGIISVLKRRKYTYKLNLTNEYVLANPFAVKNFKKRLRIMKEKQIKEAQESIEKNTNEAVRYLNMHILALKKGNVTTPSPYNYITKKDSVLPQKRDRIKNYNEVLEKINSDPKLSKLSEKTKRLGAICGIDLLRSKWKKTLEKYVRGDLPIEHAGSYLYKCLMNTFATSADWAYVNNEYVYLE